MSTCVVVERLCSMRQCLSASVRLCSCVPLCMRTSCLSARARVVVLLLASTSTCVWVGAGLHACVAALVTALARMTVPVTTLATVCTQGRQSRAHMPTREHACFPMSAYMRASKPDHE